jgi:hypothetical protein
MNRVRLTVVIYGIVIVLVFGFSINIFSRIPYECEGLSCRYYARNNCDRECDERGLMCMDNPIRVYGACIGNYEFPLCYSVWMLRCENGDPVGKINCYDIDPRCYD